MTRTGGGGGRGGDRRRSPATPSAAAASLPASPLRVVLVTGFEPFGGDARNPSGEIARGLDGRVIGGHRVVGVVLPCVFGASIRELRRHLRRLAPDLIVGTGLAAGRTAITPEKLAANLDHARIPDNAGRRPQDRPVVRGAPLAYASTLPVPAIVAAIRRRGIAADISPSAGAFVCNHVFYALMHELRRRRRVRGGFVHVPWPADWEGAARSPVPFAAEIEAIEIAIRVSLARGRPAR